MAKEIPGELLHHPVWRRVCTFFDVWGAPQNAISCTVSNLTLEFDISAASAEIPVPSIFHDFGAMGRSTGELPLPAQQLDAAQQAVKILKERAMDGVVLRNLRSCIEALPDRAHVVQFGVMTARDTNAFRVCVRLMNPAWARHYLDALDWEGERDGLAGLLGKLDGRIDYVLLNLDVAGSIRPKIGLECYLVEGASQLERWAHFLDFLAGEGIAIAAKCQAALGYPGHVDVRAAGNRWPPRLRRVSELLHPAAVSVFLRRIHHIKLVLEPGRGIEAKVYLGVRHLWVAPGSPG